MSLARHALEMALLLLVLAGPLPFSLAIALSLDRASRRLTPAANLLTVLLAWSAVQAAVALGLGAAARLRPTSVFVAEALVLVFGLALLRSAGAAPQRALGSLFPLRHAMAIPDLLTLGSLSALGAALLWQIATRPITEHDSLAYHLPSMARWYQTGLFQRLEQYPLFGHYPYTWEAVCALFLMPFREDFLVALPNLVLWGCFGLAAYCLARAMGAATTVSLSAAALALSFPIIIFNVNTMHVDLAVGAFFISAVCYAVMYLKERSRAYLGLCLAAAGLLAGAKTSGLCYALVALAPLAASRPLARLLKRATPSLPLRRSEIAIAALGLACLLFIGGFWYVRNWAETGNPLGPVAIAIPGFALPGALDLDHFRNTSLSRVFQPWSYADWQILLGQTWGRFGPALVVLGVLALAAVPSLFLRRKAIGSARLLALIGLTAIALWLYTLTPYSGDNGVHRGQLHPSVGPSMRYAFPFCGALAATAAAGATVLRLPPPLLAVVAVALTVSSLAAMKAPFWFLLVPVAWLALWLVRQPPPSFVRHRPGRGALSTALALLLAALVFVSFQARQTRDRARSAAYGPVFDYVSSQLPPGQSIAYLLCVKSYPLYGRDLTHRVIHLPLTSRDPDEWLRYLRARDIALLAIGPCGLQRDAWQTLNWLESTSLPLVRVFGTDFNTEPFLYRLDP